MPVADPILEPDPEWIGTPFIVMPRVEGHVVDGVTHGDRWLRRQTDEDRHELYRSLVDAVTRIHRSDTDGCRSVPRRDNAAELDFWEAYLQWSSDGHPVGILAEVLGWCRRHRPVTDPEPVLLWGDVRFENVVFGDDLGLRAVLDWDMCSIGAAEHDLAWLTSLDSTMERLFGSRVPGFPGRQETIGLFEGLAGRPVRDFEWYETLAMVEEHGHHDPHRLSAEGCGRTAHAADRRQSHTRSSAGATRTVLGAAALDRACGGATIDHEPMGSGLPQSMREKPP